jgi:hypothetical protein
MPNASSKRDETWLNQANARTLPLRLQSLWKKDRPEQPVTPRSKAARRQRA